MNTLNEMQNELNEMQSKHIATLEERIQVLTETIKVNDNIIKEYKQTSQSNYNEMQNIYKDNDKIKLSNITKDAIIKRLLSKE